MALYNQGRLFKANGTGYKTNPSGQGDLEAVPKSYQIAALDITRGLAIAWAELEQEFPDHTNVNEIYSITRVPAKAAEPDTSIINTTPITLTVTSTGSWAFTPNTSLTVREGNSITIYVSSTIPTGTLIKVIQNSGGAGEKVIGIITKEQPWCNVTIAADLNEPSECNLDLL
jgi:hypothetical protein